MVKKTKVAKATKKGRTRIKNLPVGEKELMAAEKKKVKGGNIAALNAATSTGASTSPTIASVSSGGDYGIKKLVGGV